MIYISAQPDDDYFEWQLRVQIHNLKSLGLTNDYHILVKVKNLLPNPKFVELQKELEGSNYKVFFYWDTRTNFSTYLPSLRPHILAQHFDIHMLNEIFYIDADIIFRELIDFSKLHSHHYVSDTVSYIGANYIMSKSYSLFNGMCNIVGIDSQVVALRQVHSGGAQYVMRNITADFWRKVEKDCVNLYLYMTNFNSTFDGHPIQAWTADMWAVLWNLWLSDLDCKVHEELSFCWPTQFVENWDNHKILHNAGVTEKQRNLLFYKADFRRDTPLEWDLDYVSPKYCSIKYVEIIKSLRHETTTRKIRLAI